MTTTTKGDEGDGGEDLVLSLTHEGQPMPKDRPRFAPRGWAYSGQRSRYYERELRAAFQVATQLRRPDGKCAYRLCCNFYRADLIRCDLDNLLKSVMDAANGVVWADDSQVVELSAKVERGVKDAARVEVAIYRVRVG